jgi:hypothetical protein
LGGLRSLGQWFDFLVGDILCEAEGAMQSEITVGRRCEKASKQKPCGPRAVC